MYSVAHECAIFSERGDAACMRAASMEARRDEVTGKGGRGRCQGTFASFVWHAGSGLHMPGGMGSQCAGRSWRRRGDRAAARLFPLVVRVVRRGRRTVLGCCTAIGEVERRDETRRTLSLAAPRCFCWLRRRVRRMLRMIRRTAHKNRARLCKGRTMHRQGRQTKHVESAAAPSTCSKDDTQPFPRSRRVPAPIGGECPALC